MTTTVSVIIPTRNRADSLHETLAAIGRVAVPDFISAELIVVDNGSTDETKAVVHASAPANMPTRYVWEPRPGQNYAYNAGLARAEGEALVFTDDDVRPRAQWLEAMCRPILLRHADALSGRVVIPPYLLRPWMSFADRVRMAEVGNGGAGVWLVGANMAFARRVFGIVPLFDVEVGPGALGLHGEGLFGRQLQAAGVSIKRAGEDSTVEHHFGVERLSSKAWRRLAVASGRSMAYIDYHWEHKTIPVSRARVCRARLQLLALRTREQAWFRREGISEHEWEQVSWLSYFRQMRLEQMRPRNYEKHGFRKVRGVLYDQITLPRSAKWSRRDPCKNEAGRA